MSSRRSRRAPYAVVIAVGLCAFLRVGNLRPAHAAAPQPALTADGIKAAEAASEAEALTRDEPPPRRSWQRPSPLDEADALQAKDAQATAAEAAITSQEYQLVRPLLRMVLVLAGIVLLILLLARGARALQVHLPGWVGGKQAAPRGPRLHVVERLTLGPKHSLGWVERDDGDAFLVAWGEGGTSLLGPLARGSRPSFAATMAEVTDEPTPPPSRHAAVGPAQPKPPGAADLHRSGV